jgi:hypothetical protein
MCAVGFQLLHFTSDDARADEVNFVGRDPYGRKIANSDVEGACNARRGECFAFVWPFGWISSPYPF